MGNNQRLPAVDRVLRDDCVASLLAHFGHVATANAVHELAPVTVAIAPNPASDVITVPDVRWTKASVMDLQGRTMQRSTLNNARLDVSTLPAGLYMLRLQDSDGREGIARFEKR